MNLFNRITLHVQRYAYKKGQFKGSAPADKNRRWRDHHRVDADASRAFVTLHTTRIITATPDGCVQLTHGSWSTQTTKEALNHHLNRYGIFIYTERKGGRSQWAVTDRTTIIPFVDNMILRPSEDGTRLLLPEERAAFKGWRVDRAKAKEVRDQLRASTFWSMMPFLHKVYETRVEYVHAYNEAKLGASRANALYNMRIASKTEGWRGSEGLLPYMLSDEHADMWPLIVARFRFHERFSNNASRTLDETRKFMIDTIGKECKQLVDLT
jgi:hypothetical protein